MKNDVLPQIKIASPCHADWGQMSGNERNRFCASCQKNVYNISAMTSKEATELIREKEGKLCVRYFLRRDGTILTQDCPVGLAAIRKQFLKIAAAFVSMLALAGFGSGCKKEESQALAGEATVTPRSQTNQPETRMGDFAVAPQTNNVPEVMGIVAVPPQTNDVTVLQGSPAPQTNDVNEIKGEVYVAPQTNDMTEIKGRIARPPQTNSVSQVEVTPIMGKLAAPSN